MIADRSRASLLGGFLILLIGASLAGCGAPDGMVEVSGTVTFNGQPIETGFVSFVPDRGKSPQAGKIKNGRFRFNAYPGQNIVRIVSEKQGAFVESMNQHTYHQFLPPKYNEQSELSEDVTAGGGNVFEFALNED
jgi:hypothetical protein